MSKKVNIGLIQMSPSLGEVKENVLKAKKFIREAAEKEANIVCLPETFATGYNLDVLGEKAIELGIEYYDFIVEKISNEAREHGLYIIAPFGEKRELNGVIYNSAILFDDEGKIVGSYAKSHLWDNEQLYYRQGSKLDVFETKYGKIGLIICYDLSFPEVSRSLCLQGADMIFAPSAWAYEDNETMWEAMWDGNLYQRAQENTLFTIGVNSVGKQENLNFFGLSKIYNPKGEQLEELPRNEEGIKVTTIDLEEVEKLRIENPFLRDRRPELYSQFTKE
ncbi:nitrilase-related carbon-nitrogen hydrolase [Lentibacillus salinarum]|uniref:Nitrilase-related carbon-nitrogen hydrolase n=1 Tax=Lentibacillus salinarum TaxID=446820 RepID=A0ABW3ZZS3_9BACI